MKNYNIEQIAESLCERLDKALIKSDQVKIAKNIEYFLSFENNKMNYFFIVPGAKKEDLKVIIEQSEDPKYINIILTKYNLKNSFKYAKSYNDKFMNKAIEKVSIIKESFNLENIEICLSEGILKLSLEAKRKNEEKLQASPIIMRF